MWLANIKINPTYEKMGMCIKQEQGKKAILKPIGILCRIIPDV